MEPLKPKSLPKRSATFSSGFLRNAKHRLMAAAFGMLRRSRGLCASFRRPRHPVPRVVFPTELIANNLAVHVLLVPSDVARYCLAVPSPAFGNAVPCWDQILVAIHEDAQDCRGSCTAPLPIRYPNKEFPPRGRIGYKKGAPILACNVTAGERVAQSHFPLKQTKKRYRQTRHLFWWTNFGGNPKVVALF